jgi:hypothetical protein
MVTEVKNVWDELQEINGSLANAIKQKFFSCVSNNTEFELMCQILCLLQGEDQADFEYVQAVKHSAILCWKLA